jgi:adenylylsulfate kinase
MKKIYWFTGQPSSGKTTLCKLLMKEFYDMSFHIDGDDIRFILNNKDYSEVGRRKNVELVQNMSKYLHNKNFNVFVSLVSPYRDQREYFKKNNDVIEIYIHTSEIRERDNFKVNNYEPPLENFIDIDTTNKTPIQSLNEIIYKLKEKSFI